MAKLFSAVQVVGLLVQVSATQICSPLDGFFACQIAAPMMPREGTPKCTKAQNPVSGTRWRANAERTPLAAC